MPERKSPPTDPLTEALTSHAVAQMRAAKARFRPADPSLEKPKDASNAFVRDFAASLNDEIGPNKLIASRREVQIRRGDLTFAYSFRASTNNTAGATIVLLPRVSVHSRKLRLWRRDKPWARTFGHSMQLTRRDGGMFIGGMLGNFFSPHRYLALDIVNEADRPMLLKQITEDQSAIDARLLADLASKEAFFAYATRDETDFECTGDSACEYVAAHWGMEAVRDYATAVLATRSNGRSEFEDELAQLSANPASASWRLSRLHGIARFFIAHKLDLG